MPFIILFICATHMFELGQDRKVAALRSSMCVHFFLEVFMNYYMNLAVEEAKKAYFNNDVPIGAVIVKDDKVISACYNRKNIDNVAVYHAEILCIIEACKNLGSWYLNDCDMYVTLRPCNMCMNALAEARIKNIYYLIDSDYENNLKSNLDNIILNKINDDCNYIDLIRTFFKNIRNND